MDSLNETTTARYNMETFQKLFKKKKKKKKKDTGAVVHGKGMSAM